MKKEMIGTIWAILFNILIFISLFMVCSISLLNVMNYVYGIRTITYLSNVDLLRYIFSISGWIILIIASSIGFNHFLKCPLFEIDGIKKLMMKEKKPTKLGFFVIISLLILSTIAFWCLNLYLNIIRNW